MAQILFIHTREDRAAADFILRAFANTNVKPLVKECSDDAMIFAPGTQFEKTVQESSAVFVLLSAAAANDRNLKNQFVSVCNYAALTTMKDVWIFESAEQFAKIATTVNGFKHYARFEISDGWAVYLRELIKYYDDSGTPWLLATAAGSGAALAEKDKFAGAFLGVLAGAGLLLLKNLNQSEFGLPVACLKCRREFRIHLTVGTKEFRCLACGIFYVRENSRAFNFLNGRKHLNGNANKLPPVGSANLVMNEQIKVPTAFISYSWDSNEHKNWVRDLAARLRDEGIDVMLDQWHSAPGDPLPEFMERAVSENGFVLLVCTPNFKAKADERRGGVGYEGNIMTGELFLKSNQRKFIPILRHGDWAEAAPTWLQSKRYLDLSDKCFDENFEDLVKNLHGERTQPPPIGKRVRREPPPNQVKTAEPRAKLKIAEEVSTEDKQTKLPIKITGIIPEEISKPQMDGTRGSGLYAVPFRLSARPPEVWARLFVENWNHPPSFTSMHRPGIAKVFADTVVLDGTTVEEVEKYHQGTLLAVVKRTNQQFEEYDARLRREAEMKQEADSKLKENIDETLKRIRFE